MDLNSKAHQPLKQNRNVKHEKVQDRNSVVTDQHYMSGNGKESSIQREKESKTLIDQPPNTREYHYQSGSGGISPIREQSKYIVGGRVERNRASIDIDPGQAGKIRDYVQARIVRDVPETATGERRDFIKEYTKDDNLAGSINNNGKPPKVYERFIRPPNRLANQKINIDKIEKTQDSQREYHYPSGMGTKSPTPAMRDSDAEKGYHYPSGKGDKSPIVGKILPGRA